MKTAQAQLVTIILPFGVGDRLTRELKTLGVSGYTTMHVNGFGATGTRSYGLTDGANLRLETVVSLALCERIMEHLSAHYEGQALVAHHHTVMAMPATHFGSEQ